MLPEAAMTTRRWTTITSLGATVLLLVLALAARAAVELKGTVVAVSGQEVRIKVDSEMLPEVGDAVTLSFSVSGGLALPIGTWRVSRIDGDVVVATQVEATGRAAPGHAATITSENPRRREQPTVERPAPGGSSPPRERAPGPHTPPIGPTSPAPWPRSVGIGAPQLTAGPLRIGEGRSEWSPGRFVIASSAGYSTWFAISTEPARDLYATVRMRVERAKGPYAVAGVELSASPNAQLEPGGIFFGKSDSRGVLLALKQREEGWVDIPLGSRPARPVLVSEADLFEVTSRAGAYEFKLNGTVIATWRRPMPRAEWVRVWAGHGNRAEFLDWRVARPE